MNPRAVVAALAVTQTVGYGTLYYAFAVFLGPLTTDLHASPTAVTGSFTASVLTAAALAVPVGRRLDRYGGRGLMTMGSLAGALLLVAWSQVQNLTQLYAVQIGLGAAGAASLYEAAFAVIIARHSAAGRANALLALTVVAGFASTIFLPLTGRLVHDHGWRAALLILAVIQAVLTVPAHAIFLRHTPATTGTPAAVRPAAGVLLRVLGDRGFWLLAAAFTASTAAIAAVTVHLIAALVSWGHSPTSAAAVAGLFGILSVTGRLAVTGLQRRLRTTSVVAAVFVVQAVAAGMLPVIGRNLVAAVVAVVGFGLGFGVATIAKPVLLAERYGIGEYATIAGLLVVPATIAKAGAPLGAAAVVRGGYAVVFLAIAASCLVAAAALLVYGRPSVSSKLVERHLG